MYEQISVLMFLVLYRIKDGSACTCVQGFISTEEFLSIPELSINPLHTRMGQIFNHVNFKVSP